jgi:hypothetical protein
MASGIFAAGIVVFGIGAMAAPVESSAGSGGPIAAPSFAARGAVRPSVAAPPSAHTFLSQGMIGRTPAGISGLRMSRHADRRGPGFPLWWGDATYVPNYYPSEYAAPYGEFPYAYPPFENFSERSRPVVTYEPGCRTDTQTVPAENGGERTIHITRCY